MIVGESVLHWIFWYLYELLKIPSTLNRSKPKDVLSADLKITNEPRSILYESNDNIKEGMAFFFQNFFTSEPGWQNLLQTISAVMISSWVIIHLCTPKIL